MRAKVISSKINKRLKIATLFFSFVVVMTLLFAKSSLAYYVCVSDPGGFGQICGWVDPPPDGGGGYVSPTPTPYVCNWCGCPGYDYLCCTSCGCPGYAACTQVCPAGTDLAGQVISTSSSCNLTSNSQCGEANPLYLTVSGSLTNYSATYRMTNNGQSTWNSGYSLRLINSVGTVVTTVAVSGSVYPGGTYTFTVPYWTTTPPAPASAITYQLQMMRSGTLFGTACNVSINLPAYSLSSSTSTASVTYDASGNAIFSYGIQVSNACGTTSSAGTNTGQIFFTVNSVVNSALTRTYTIPVIASCASYGYSASDVNVGIVPVGAKVCSYMTISPYTNASVSPNSKSNAPGLCTTIAARPYFKVFGGDMIVGGAPCSSTIATGSGASNVYAEAQTVAANDNRGASTNGAIFSTGIIRTAFSGVNSLLAFASFGSSTDLGTCIKDYFADSTSATNNVSSNSVALASLSNLSTVTYLIRPASGTTVVLSGINANAVLYVDGDAIITGATFIAKQISASGNVKFASDVQNATGTFTSRNDIDTCTTSTGAAIATNSLYTTCNKQLNIYGKFSGGSIKLRRTFGDLKLAPLNESFPNTNAAENFIVQNNSPQPSLGSTQLGSTDSITGLAPIF